MRVKGDKKRGFWKIGLFLVSFRYGRLPQATKIVVMARNIVRIPTMRWLVWKAWRIVALVYYRKKVWFRAMCFREMHSHQNRSRMDNMMSVSTAMSACQLERKLRDNSTDSRTACDWFLPRTYGQTCGTFMFSTRWKTAHIGLTLILVCTYSLNPINNAIA